DGKQIDLTEISNDVLETSQVRYSFEFDEKKLVIEGQARLNYFRPQEKTERYRFSRLVEDNGEAFFQYLANNKKAHSYNLAKPKTPGWFIQYRRELSFDEIDKIEMNANPGRFKGRIDSFDLSAEEGKQLSAFDKISEYRGYIKDLSGISVYRDGFGIRVDRDWLGLGQQSTSGKSYYGLRINNVLGYIALSARENGNLEETTDREGFVVNSYYENFYKILQKFVNFTAEGQQFLRREWNNYRNLQDEKVAKVKGPANAPEQLSKRIKESTAKARGFKEPIQKTLNSLSQKSEKARRVIASLPAKSQGSSRDLKRLTGAVEELSNATNDALDIISKLQGYLDEIDNLAYVETVLDNQIKRLREQLEQIYELVSLGLTAEARSHELHNVDDRFEKQTVEFLNHHKKQPAKDAKTVTFAENMRTGINALRKQLAHLAPSLKYVREKKEHIDLLSFCSKDLAGYHNESSGKDKITVNIESTGNGNFSVHMNRGKLLQVFDNLILNSRYWLHEDIRMEYITQGDITVTISKPFVRVTDNGRGILPLVEATLFEPFITTKTRGEGRGLGLFIVQQLLDSEGCVISLLPERNSNDRPYIFEIDFSGRTDER
ncbi:MAG: HAMP domain-containing histidine kinase, partial [bacterium]|nr:HAMP domain-containing histidine kinase [bacterium]